jgi:steroid delta-isomerase-like uncharacterized protein
MTASELGRLRRRLAVVDEHVRCDNRHDLDAVMATFGDDARFDDEPWGDHRQGRDGVRSYYVEIMSALPDLVIDVKERHVASESVVLEVTIQGTHLGPWRGLPATVRRVGFPLCSVYQFDSADRLLAERVYYDRAAVLGQLGMFHEPLRGLGRIVTALSHPLTLARAYLFHLSRKTKAARPPQAA